MAFGRHNSHGLSYTCAVEQIALDWTPEPHYFSVSELANALRRVFTEYFTDIWVAGEISGVKLYPSGHYYFTLKDEGAQRVRVQTVGVERLDGG